MVDKLIIVKLNNKYFLRAGKRLFNCQIGQGGIKKSSKKIEGDKSTPSGKWNIISIYLRYDKIKRPVIRKKSSFKYHLITKNCAWCDDIYSNVYNKYFNTIRFSADKVNHEKLWREDDVYDIILVMSYNTKPIIKNKGSAIFLHCSFYDNRNTLGCIAIKKINLILLLSYIKKYTYIKI